jgi:L-lactate dehydrogenase complex protein LldE
MGEVVRLNVPVVKNPRVGLFVTCLTDQFYPRVGVAVTKILEHFGCRVEFPAGQTCCGQPFYNNGFAEQATRLGRRMIELFSGFDYVVTPSGSCCAMVRGHYRQLLGEEKLSGRTYEFAEFLEKVLRVDFSAFKLPVKRTVTYHYACHLRGIEGPGEGANLLRKIGNVEFRAMEKAEQCCGFGGTFAVKYPAISGAIVEDKTNCIAATGASTLICNDAGCTMNISGMCHRQGMGTEVRHMAELIAEAMGLEIDGW